MTVVCFAESASSHLEVEPDGADKSSESSESDSTSDLESSNSESLETDDFKPRSLSRPRTLHKCKFCSKTYQNVKAYEKHVTMHKTPVKAKTKLKSYKCADCGSECSTPEGLIYHVKQSPQCASNLRCDECNKRFASANSWIGHMKLHKERPFWCFLCARGFNRNDVFDYHMQRHKCRTYQCSMCPKKFRLFSQLNDHVNVHTGAKPHICTYCGKGFSQSASMYVHKKIHINNPFKARRRTTATPTIRRINNVERLHLQKTAQTLAGAIKQTPHSTEQHGRPVAKQLEWECCDCDQSFEEVTQLHSHYIQHAAGEIPMSLLTG